MADKIEFFISYGRMEGQQEVLIGFVLCDDMGRQITIVIDNELDVCITKNYKDEVFHGKLNPAQVMYVLGIYDEVYSYDTYHAYLMELARAGRIADIIQQ